MASTLICGTTNLVNGENGELKIAAAPCHVLRRVEESWAGSALGKIFQHMVKEK